MIYTGATILNDYSTGASSESIEVKFEFELLKDEVVLEDRE